MKRLTRPLSAALLVASLAGATAQNPQNWTGYGSNLNWTDTGNWDPANVPTSAEVLYFGDLLYPGYTNAAGLVNNIVDTSLAAGAAYYQAVSAGSFSGVTNRAYTTLIPAGVTLNLGGLSGLGYPAALAVGDIPGSLQWFNLSTWTNYATITGPGTLAINDPLSLVSVGMRNRATLDLRSLSRFEASVKQLWAGVTRENITSTGPVGWLLLGETNLINTPANPAVPGVLLGYATNASGTGVLELGRVNTFNTDGLVVGGRRSTTSFLRFGSAYSNASPSSTFTLRGSAGGNTPIPSFTIGDTMANPDGYGVLHPGNPAGGFGTADFSGGTVDILADSIWIGRGSTVPNNSASGTGNGTLIVDSGAISTTNLYIGVKPTAGNATVGQGNLILRGSAMMNVASNVALVFRTNGTAFIDTSSISVSNNAVLNIGGNFTTVMSIGSWTPASVNLGGGTINLTGGGEVSVPRLTGFGAINNASTITVTNAFSVGGDTVAGTLNLGNNLVLGPTLTNLVFNLGANTTVGGGVNDYLSVANDLTLSGNPSLSLTYGGPLVTGTYKLAGYGGTLNGTVSWVNPTRSPIGLVQGGGQIALVVTNSTPASLVWKGPAAGAGGWDTSTLNWDNNTERFFTLDNVLFNDTGAATTVTIPGVVTPSSVVFNNSTLDYTVTGGGRIDGFTGITKNGAGTLFMAISGANQTFTGPININQGMVRIDAFNTGMFGTATNSPINIANGGALDIGGGTVGSPGSYGRQVYVSGAGPTGTGAITHTRGSANPSLNVLGVTLQGNTSFGSVIAGNTLNVNGLFPPHSGVVDLGGHTLTTVGAGNVRFQQATITNAGNITLGGPFQLLNCYVDGPGTLALGANLLTFSSWTAGYLGKAITVNGGAFNNSAQSAIPVVIGSPIALNGMLSLTNTQPFWLTNSLTGIGGLLKAGNSNLLLTAANSYSGPTRVIAGRLVLGADASLTSPSITIDPAGTFDATARPAGYTILSGQTLALGGTAAGGLTVGSGGTLSGGGVCLSPLTVSAGGTVAPGTRLAAGTLTVGTNLVFNGGKALFKLGSNPTPGSGFNDLLVVNGDLSFNSPTVIQVDPIATISGTYTVMQYSGALSGSANLQLQTDSRYLLEFDLTVPGLIQVRVKGAAGNLTWRGGAPANPTLWNINGVSNWVAGSTSSAFFNGDTVNFDDAANTNRVLLQTELKPAAINFNQFSTDYTLEGAGSLLAGSLTSGGSGSVTVAYRGDTALIGDGLLLNGGTVNFNQPTNTTFIGKVSGFAGLNKQGPHTLTVNNTDSSSLFASVGVLGGTLRPGTSNAFGSGSVTVAPGATLDLNGQALNSAQVRVSGQGLAGTGAINNYGTVQTNALSSLTLDSDATVGAAGARWDVISGGFVAGNGYALTKVGPGEVRLGSGSDTGLGELEVNEGTLTFANPGTTLGSGVGAITVRPGASLAFAGGVEAGTKPANVADGAFLDGLQVLGGSGIALSRYDGDVLFGGPGNVRVEGLANLTLGGALRGPAGVRLVNSGALTLAGDNTYSGDTTNNIGVLTIANSKSLPATTRLWNINNGTPSSSTAFINLASNAITPPTVPLIMVSTRGASGNLPTTLAGDGTWQGPINLIGLFPSGTIEPEFGFSGGVQEGLTVTGPISFTNATATVSISGSGNVRLMSPLQFTGTFFFGQLGLGLDATLPFTTLTLGSSANSWTNTNLRRGRINLAADDPFPAVPTVMRNLQGNHRFLDIDLHGHRLTVGDSWQDAFTMPVRFGNSSTNANATVVHATPATITNTWAVYLVDDLDAQVGYTNQLALTVNSGTLALIQTNTYTGPTLVNGGSLLLNLGSGFAAGLLGQIVNSPVTVSGTGTFGGLGSVLSPVTVNAGGTLSPGQFGVGRFFVANTLALNPSSQMRCEINITGNTNDAVYGITDLTLNGVTLVVSNTTGAFANGQSFKLFDAATYTVGPVTVQPPVPGPGLAWDISELGVNGRLKVTTQTGVPPVVGGVAVLGDGNVGFTLTGTPGQPYTVRASENATAPLNTWSILQSSTLPQPVWLFVDPTATNSPYRFYSISTP